MTHNLLVEWWTLLVSNNIVHIYNSHSKHWLLIMSCFVFYNFAGSLCTTGFYWLFFFFAPLTVCLSRFPTQKSVSKWLGKKKLVSKCRVRVMLWYHADCTFVGLQFIQCWTLELELFCHLCKRWYTSHKIFPGTIQYLLLCSFWPWTFP